MKMFARPERWLPVLALLLGGCAARSDASGAARMTFVIFFCFLAGIYLVSSHSMSLIYRLRIAQFIKKHIWRLCLGTYILGTAMVLPGLLCALIVDYGTAEAVSISIVILGLCFVLTALCLKRWDETGDDTWLRRNLQTFYVGIICFSAINYFVGKL